MPGRREGPRGPGRGRSPGAGGDGAGRGLPGPRLLLLVGANVTFAGSPGELREGRQGKSNTPAQSPTLGVCGLLFPRGEFGLCFDIPKRPRGVGGRTVTQGAAPSLEDLGTGGAEDPT